MPKQSEWLLNGDLPRSHWEGAVANYQTNKTSSKKIKAQNDYKGPNKNGDLVHVRYTVDNGGNKKMRPELSSKAVLKELKRDANRPKPVLSEGEKLFMRERAKAVSEYNSINGYNYDNPKAAELDHIYGSRTPQHPAFIVPRERLVNQVKGGQAADAGFNKLNIYNMSVEKGKGLNQLVIQGLKKSNRIFRASNVGILFDAVEAVDAQTNGAISESIDGAVNGIKNGINNGLNGLHDFATDNGIIGLPTLDTEAFISNAPIKKGGVSYGLPTLTIPTRSEGL